MVENNRDFERDKRTGEDVQRGSDRLAEDKAATAARDITDRDIGVGSYLVPPPPPLWQRLARGTATGIAMGIAAAIVIYAVNTLGGGQSLQERTERNAQINVAAAKGLRCILNEPKLPPQGPKRLAVFDRCYAEFDRLVKEGKEDP